MFNRLKWSLAIKNGIETDLKQKKYKYAYRYKKTDLSNRFENNVVKV